MSVITNCCLIRIRSTLSALATVRRSADGRKSCTAAETAQPTEETREDYDTVSRALLYFDFASKISPHSEDENQMKTDYFHHKRFLLVIPFFYSLFVSRSLMRPALHALRPYCGGRFNRNRHTAHTVRKQTLSSVFSSAVTETLPQCAFAVAVPQPKVLSGINLTNLLTPHSLGNTG